MTQLPKAFLSSSTLHRDAAHIRVLDNGQQRVLRPPTGRRSANLPDAHFRIASRSAGFVGRRGVFGALIPTRSEKGDILASETTTQGSVELDTVFRRTVLQSVRLIQCGAL